MKGIAIVGAHPGTRGQAPFDDPRWQVWSLSAYNHGHIPRHDLWFELHDPDFINTGFPEFYDWLAEQPAVMTRDAVPDWPGSRAYPKDEMLAKYGGFFFTSSIAWMLALAMEQWPDAIGLWGVEMVAADEWGYQRAGCHHFMQIAKHSKIDVIVPEGSHLMMPPPLYGWEFSGP
jgi:hypothetical protein